MMVILIGWDKSSASPATIGWEGSSLPLAAAFPILLF
jgi:hypothetical protein